MLAKESLLAAHRVMIISVGAERQNLFNFAHIVINYL